MSIYDDLQLRVATPDDLTEIMEMAVAAAKENAAFSADQELLLKNVWGPLNQQHGLIGCIGKPNGAIEGMIVLSVGTLFYTNDVCLEEKVMYVRPEYRNARGGRATKLVTFAKSVAKKLGLPLLIGILSNEMTKQKVALYKRELGEPAGAFWIINAETGGHQVT